MEELQTFIPPPNQSALLPAKTQFVIDAEELLISIAPPAVEAQLSLKTQFFIVGLPPSQQIAPPTPALPWQMVSPATTDADVSSLWK
jgi:hypothetical protein